MSMPTPTISKPKLRLENIMYATDFRAHSKAALPYTLALARKYGSRIHVVHVVALSPFSAPAPTSALRAIESQGIREAKEAAMELSPFWGSVPNETIIRKGDVWREISKIVEQMQIDLIVTGTHGRSGMTKVFLGSVAERIFRHARCPVLTVGPQVQANISGFEDMHSILVPVDFSPESLAGVSCAASLAELNRSRLYLVHVVPPNEEGDPSLKEKLYNLIPGSAELACLPKAFVDQGPAAPKILDTAKELAVDLIVLGVKPPALFEGTSTHQTMATAYDVVVSANCPVMTVRASS